MKRAPVHPTVVPGLTKNLLDTVLEKAIISQKNAFSEQTKFFSRGIKEILPEGSKNAQTPIHSPENYNNSPGELK